MEDVEFMKETPVWTVEDSVLTAGINVLTT